VNINIIDEKIIGLELIFIDYRPLDNMIQNR